MHLKLDPHVVGFRRPISLRAAGALVAVLIVLIAFVVPAANPTPAAAARLGACPSAAAVLEEASRGLLMPSESDYPFIPFVWKQRAISTLTPAGVLKLAGHRPDTPVVVVSLADFFRNVAQRQPWHDPVQAAQVRQFRRLVNVLEANLMDIRVYRVGVVHVDVYIVGQAGRDLVGLSTVVIET